MFGLRLLILLLISKVTFAYDENKLLPNNNAQLSFAPLVKTKAPAVVNIYTKSKQKQLSPFFRHFLQDFAEIEDQQIINSLGSGVIIAPDGLIVTNYHVIKDCDQIIVSLNNKQEYEAKIKLIDKKFDLALLNIEVKTQMPYLKLADSDQLEVGDIVLAIGNPFGIGQTVTQGIISAPARSFNANSKMQQNQFFIQTDAAINPGNSGGALINMAGELVGINTAIISNSGEFAGVGFAIPANILATILSNQDFKLNKIKRGWLGIITDNITSELAYALNLELPVGVIIKEILPASPITDKLQVGDVIIAINDQPISDNLALKFRIATINIGSEIKVSYLRDNKLSLAKLNLIAPPDLPKAELKKINGQNPLSGAGIINLSPLIAQELDLESIKGVVISEIEQPSYAQRFGLKINDLIVSLNLQKITSTKQLINLLNEPLTRWDIVIRRADKLLSLSINK